MFSEVIQVVGGIGVVLSLLLLAWQTRRLTQQTRISNAIGTIGAHYSSIERLHEILGNIVIDVGLRPYFYERQPCPPGSPDRDKALIVAEMLGDNIEFGLMIADLLPMTSIYGGWKPYALFCAEQPLLHEVFNTHPEWWPYLMRYLDESGVPRSLSVRHESQDVPEQRSA